MELTTVQQKYLQIVQAQNAERMNTAITEVAEECGMPIDQLIRGEVKLAPDFSEFIVIEEDSDEDAS